MRISTKCQVCNDWRKKLKRHQRKYIFLKNLFKVTHSVDKVSLFMCSIKNLYNNLRDVPSSRHDICRCNVDIIRDITI